ncbi:MAG: hypothetical protein M1834_003231 [Cirrosporium novae-zelandiae]|nr:MAG: hypothetical protein M1834_003231 [Cirrosporium novae-zelandiae]
MSADVRDAVKISKYPPLGKRSLTAALPQFEFALTPASTITTEVNKSGSTVFLMVETEECLRNIDEIASEPGVDVLLVGSNDLAIELDTLGNWDDPRFIEALETVGCAAKKHGKIFGIAGLYHRPDILSRVVNEMGARYVLGGLDIGMITSAACQNLKLLRSIQGSSPNLPRQSSD